LDRLREIKTISHHTLEQRKRKEGKGKGMGEENVPLGCHISHKNRIVGGMSG